MQKVTDTPLSALRPVYTANSFVFSLQTLSTLKPPLPQEVLPEPDLAGTTLPPLCSWQHPPIDTGHYKLGNDELGSPKNQTWEWGMGPMVQKSALQGVVRELSTASLQNLSI